MKIAVKILLRFIEENPLVVTVSLSICGFLLGLFGETVAQEWVAKNITASSGGTLTMIAVLLLVLLTMSAAAIDLMLKLHRKVGIKVRYYENDKTGKVYDACRRIIEQADQTIDILNSYLVEGHDPKGSPRAREERKKYYAALLDRACKHDVKYRRIVQVRTDRTNLQEMKDDLIHETHLRVMLDHARRRYKGRISLVECSPSRVTTFVLVDGENLIWQINEVHTDPSGKERLNLQGAFIFHDPQRRITPHFEDYFHKLWASHNGELKLEVPAPMKPRAKKGIGNRAHIVRHRGVAGTSAEHVLDE